MGEAAGLVVLELRADTDAEATVVYADSWRLEGRGNAKLRVLLDTRPSKTEDYWTIGEDLAAVEKNEDHDPPSPGLATLTRVRAGANWEYGWSDFNEAVLVVLWQVVLLAFEGSVQR